MIEKAQDIVNIVITKITTILTIDNILNIKNCYGLLFSIKPSSIKTFLMTSFDLSEINPDI